MPLRGTQNPMKMGSGSCMLRLRPWHRVEAVFVSGAFSPHMSPARTSGAPEPGAPEDGEPEG